MNLPARIPKPPKRSSRWRSRAHCNFVRGFACSNCGSTSGIEVAHVRLGSGAGMGQKPDDWNTVSLCRDCHAKQHTVGEQTFWAGRDLEALVGAFVKASPKRHEIENAIRERGE
jgi:5-methylcytosine-specific restriction endonuclease McrA